MTAVVILCFIDFDNPATLKIARVALQTKRLDTPAIACRIDWFNFSTHIQPTNSVKVLAVCTALS